MTDRKVEYNWIKSKPKPGFYMSRREGTRNSVVRYFDGKDWYSIRPVPSWRTPKHELVDWPHDSYEPMPKQYRNLKADTRFEISPVADSGSPIMWGERVPQYTDTERIDLAIKRGLLLSNFRQEMDELLKGA